MDVVVDEMRLLSPKQFNNKFSDPTLNIGGSTISQSPSIGKFCVLFDPNLSSEKHERYYKDCNITKTHPFLSMADAETLVNAVVSSVA